MLEKPTRLKSEIGPTEGILEMFSSLAKEVQLCGGDFSGFTAFPGQKAP